MVKDKTNDFLRSFGLGYWLLGYEPLGELLDLVGASLQQKEKPEPLDSYCAYLAQKYGMPARSINRGMRRCVELAWREDRVRLEAVLGVQLPRQPKLRFFVYRAAEMLNQMGE